MTTDNDITHVVPNTVRATAERAEKLHDCNLDVKANAIYLLGEHDYNAGQGVDETEEPGVEYIMANKFMKNLHILMGHSNKPIVIHMKTCGGHWVEGIAIYDMIRACPNKVTILNYSHARSMSSIILQAADKRVMMPNSYFLFHDGTMSANGTVKQYLNEAEELKRNNKLMADIYVRAMRNAPYWADHSDTQIRNWLRKQMDTKEDVYVHAEDSVKYGFADEVFGSSGVYDWESLTRYP